MTRFSDAQLAHSLQKHNSCGSSDVEHEGQAGMATGNTLYLNVRRWFTVFPRADLLALQNKENKLRGLAVSRALHNVSICTPATCKNTSPRPHGTVQINDPALINPEVPRVEKVPAIFQKCPQARCYPSWVSGLLPVHFRD